MYNEIYELLMIVFILFRFNAQDNWYFIHILLDKDKTFKKRK